MLANCFQVPGHCGRYWALHWCCLPRQKNPSTLHKNGLFRICCLTRSSVGLEIMHMLYTSGTGRYSFSTWHCATAKQCAYVAAPLFLLPQLCWPWCCIQLLRNQDIRLANANAGRLWSGCHLVAAVLLWE